MKAQILEKIAEIEALKTDCRNKVHISQEEEIRAYSFLHGYLEALQTILKTIEENESK